MMELVREIERLKENDEVRNLVSRRIREFERRRSRHSLFKELCFCILTAGCSAKQCMQIQRKIGDGFMYLPRARLERKLRELGYRFPGRAEYIASARRYADALPMVLKRDPDEVREWLVKNIKGIGYKEASHFMRNIGFKDVAIIDRHILRVLRENGIWEGRLSSRGYLEAERKLREIADRAGVTLAELDLYLWYMKTGNILK